MNIKSAHAAATAAAALSLALLGTPAVAADVVPKYVTDALAKYVRPQSDLYSDPQNKPGEIMTYAGVKPGQVVADIMPEGGYWSRIMSVIVGKQGAVYMIIPMGPGGSRTETGPGPLVKDINQNRPLNRVQLALAIQDQPDFPNATTFWTSGVSGGESLGPLLSVPKQVDVVITDGDYHVLKSPEFKHLDMADANKGIFRGMNNGGTYVVIEKASAVSPDVVKKDVLGAGFVLDGESNILTSTGRYVLRFRKPANAANTNKRPPDFKTAVAGYIGNTRQSNPGLVSVRPAPPGTSGLRERRVIYHDDLTYHEYGQPGSGDNAWQNGWLFYNADGEGCMWHSYPVSERGFIACSIGRAMPGKKLGDAWWGEDRIYRFVGPGYVPFPNKPAEPGGTLGNTPIEIARGFGEIWKILDQVKSPQSYRNEYLGAYRAFRGNHKEVPRATLDKEFESAYGKSIAALHDD